MLKRLFKQTLIRPINHTDEEWNDLQLMNSISGDALMCRLLNIVNDKEEFKKELGIKLTSLNVGESIKVMVGWKIKLLQKEENGKVTIH